MQSPAPLCYIYADLGVARHTLSALEQLCQRWGFCPCFVSAHDIISSQLERPPVFIIPGGADVPYTQKLNGAGNSVIKNWVANGTTYIGICAGAYYGCASIHWDNTAHDPNDRIIAPRELQFYNGTAYGALYPYDNAPQSQTAQTLWINGLGKTPLATHYNGGCTFDCSTGITDKSSTVLATYDLIEYTSPPHLPPMPTGGYPAIIKCKYQNGTVILSGIHFELPDPENQNHHHSIQNQIKNHI